MATIALMIGGAILNATAFIGGSYIAKSLSTTGNSDAERKRHDLALEKYTNDWQTYQKKKKSFEDWQYQREEEKTDAIKEFQTTDEALQYYNSTHQDLHSSYDQSAFSNKESTFSNYYKPSTDQKKGELLYVGGGMLGIGYLASKWL